MPPMKGGPMAHGGMAATEKPKNFKRAIGKLIKYMKSSLPAIIVSFALAIGAVVLTLNIPNILGDVINDLTEALGKKMVYSAVEENLDLLGMSSMEEAAEFTSEAISSAGNLKDKYEVTVTDIIGVSYEAGNTDFIRGVLVSLLGKTEADKILAGGEGGGMNSDMSALMDIPLYVAPMVPLQSITNMLILVMVLVVLSGGITFVQSYILAGVAQKISYRFRKDIDEKINKLPLKFFDDTSYGEVLSYLTNDVDNISTTLNQSLAQLVTSITTIVGVLIMMLRISWLLTLIAVAVVPISLLLVMLVVRFSQKHFAYQQKYLSDVNGHIEEMYGAHQVVELYNGQEDSKAAFDKLNSNLASSTRKSQFISGLMMPVMTFIGNVGYVLTCVVGGWLITTGAVSGIGNITAFIQYIRQFNQPITQLGSIVNTLQLTAASAERVFGFIEAEEEKETGEGLPQNASGAVEFKNVRFGYNPDNIIIKDFSSEIAAGQRVAIVGPTGAGKTTMVKLLMRYYDINSGQILLDGVDINAYSRAGMRTEFGMVLQDTWLFSGTIMENIRYGRLDATDEEVIRAAKIACADHFIRTLEGGYNFMINEEADNVSQGQKQLLTIARAVLADPKVLILDEATSSVDTRTELLIQKAMDRLMNGRTSFIIAHRLSTIKDADKILVMKDGDIVEQGNHRELMEKDGFYANLYNSQFA